MNHTEELTNIGTNVQNLVARATWLLEFCAALE